MIGKASVTTAEAVALARIGIDQGRREVAQLVRGQNFGRRRYRTVDPEFHLGLHRLRKRIRNLERRIGNVELAARRRVGHALADGDALRFGP